MALQQSNSYPSGCAAGISQCVQRKQFQSDVMNLLTGFNDVLLPEAPWQWRKLGCYDGLGASLFHEVL